MILSLHVRNLALIEDAVIEFGRGMHVLTGETGAGKSIVVDAVNLVLGGRADRDLIRTGTERAWVEAVFDEPDNEALTALIASQQLDWDGRTVTLCREITRSGRNLCRVCGVLLPLSFLKEAADLLMDVHGQHEHQFLMDPDRHLAFFDAAGGEAHQALLRETADACAAFLACHREYVKLVRENDQKTARMAYLTDALEELKQARLRKGEEELLRREKERGRSGQLIADALNEASAALTPSAEDGGAVAAVRQASAALAPLVKLGGAQEELAKRCESIAIELQELNYDIESMKDAGGFDPVRMEQIENRLDLIRRMERRYGGATLDDVLAEYGRMQEEYDRFASLDSVVADKGKEHRRLLAAYRNAAARLSEARHSLAPVFEGRIMEQLRDLGMEKLVFKAAFHEAADGKQRLPRASGEDDVEFMISPNPGEPLKPMSKIASGGELSRIMLAVKTLEAEKNGVGTMVFDEIDTGISGRTAQAVAAKMALISASRQVICVTHLPQLAAMADRQYLVEKNVSDGRTHTAVTCLDQAGRVEEIARMLSGADGSDASAREHAARMMARAAASRAGADRPVSAG